MENTYAAYYTTQAGNGISGFSGTRFQRGHGFFGRVFSGILPILKYLGRQALSTGVSVAQDALQGNDLKASVKRNAADTIANIAGHFSKRAKLYSQTGTGNKRKKVKRKTVNDLVIQKLQPLKRRKRKVTRKKHKKSKVKKSTSFF